MIRVKLSCMQWIVALATIVSVLAPSPASALRTVYTASASGDTMYPLSVASDGSIAALGSFSLTSDPEAVTMSADGQHVYVARAGSDAISVYDVQFNAALQYASAAATGATPVALAISPSGDRLFSADASGVSAFDVANDGSLSPSSGGRLQLPGTAPAGLAVSPDGSLLFVTDKTNNKLKILSVGTNGQLASAGDADTGLAPIRAVVPVAGGSVYVANSGSGTISGF